MQQQQQQLLLHELQQLLQQTMQPNVQSVQTAELKLDALSKQPEFPGSLLLLLSNPHLDQGIQHAAAIYLKNYVRRLWDLDEAQGGVSAANRLLLKEQLLQLLQQQQQLARGIETQLAEALRRVAAADFPLEWQALLPSLVQHQLQLPTQQEQLQQQQVLQVLQQLVRGLTTIHALTKKYRHLPRSEDVLLQLQQILKDLQQPLLSVFTFSVQQLLACAAAQQQQQQQQPIAAAAMEAALQDTLLSSKIFLSLSSVDLPEFFEDNLSFFVLGFAQVLQLPIHSSSSSGTVAADEEDDGDIGGGLEHLKSVICDALRLYAHKYQEEIQPFISLVVHAVWCAVRPLDARTRFDLLLAAAAECLSAAAATMWDKAPLPQQFATAAAAFGMQQQQVQQLQQKLQQGPANPFLDGVLLREIVDAVLLPNVPLRDKDLELLRDSPLDFVRRDVETVSSCAHLPRRACVSDLIKSLLRLQQQELRQLLLQLVQQLATQAAAARRGETETGARLLDSAAFVMAAVAAKTRLHAAAATVADLAGFFNTHLRQELQQQQPPRSPLAVAAALKYLATFRNQLPPQLLEESVSLLSPFLVSPSVAVRGYAAFCLERLLAVKTSEGKRLINPMTNGPVLLKCLSLLRQSLSESPSDGNEFSLKVAGRLLIILEAAAAGESLLLLQPLLQQIQAAAAQPANPVFCHYLFETLAAICRLAPQHFAADAAAATATTSAAATDKQQQQQQQQQQQVERHVVPVLSVLIRQGQHEFTPYCFQILGVLLQGASSTNTLSCSPMYAELLQTLLQPELWAASQGNVPALVRLVSLFLRHQQQQQQQHQHDLLQQLIQQRIAQLLERLQFCLYHRRLATTGFELLNAIFRYVSFEVYRQLFPTLVTVLLKRAHQLQQPAFNAQLSFSLLFFQCRSPDVLVLPAALEELQQGLLQQVVRCVMLPAVRETVDAGVSLAKRQVFMVGLSRLAAAAAAPAAPPAVADPAMLQQVLETLETLINTQVFETSAERTERRAADYYEADDDEAVLELKTEFDVSYSRLAFANTTQITDYLDDLVDMRGLVRVSLSPLSSKIQQLAAHSGKPTSALLQLLA